MKRRYKRGDWLRVPLGGERDALAIIARACRSRLFGYFFAYPAEKAPAHDELRALRAQDAIAAMLFGGAPIEDGRWQIVATSLAFDERAWPFPEFGSRGAFGEAWTRVRYDPQTLQIIERSSISAQAAQALPDARFADANDAEALLRRCLGGEAMPRVQSICEVRSPFDDDRLRALEHGGTLQFSTALRSADLARLAAFIDAHPHVQIRVHGFRRGFDARQLAPFTRLRHLTIDAHALQHAQALASLRTLRRLRIGALPIDLGFLEGLTELTELELRGTRADLSPVEQRASLQTLLLESTRRISFSRAAWRSTLQNLTLAHGAYDVEDLEPLPSLRRLALRTLEVTRLPPVNEFERLESLDLRELHGLADLRPIANARSLRELRIAGMPQLNVADFEPLVGAGLRNVDIDVGSRRKTREIYRLLQSGNR